MDFSSSPSSSSSSSLSSSFHHPSSSFSSSPSSSSFSSSPSHALLAHSHAHQPPPQPHHHQHHHQRSGSGSFGGGNTNSNNSSNSNNSGFAFHSPTLAPEFVHSSSSTLSSSATAAVVGGPGSSGSFSGGSSSAAVVSAAAAAAAAASGSGNVALSSSPSLLGASAAARDDAEGRPVLRRWFFVYDKTVCQDEDDNPEEMILYFYPPDAALKYKLFIIGAVSSMIDFAKNFTASNVTVLSLEYEKLACISDGNKTLVLLADISLADAALVSDLETIHGALKFFLGPFDLFKLSPEGNYQPLIKALQEQSRYIVPFILGQDGQPFPSFDRIPYTYLPPMFSRFFLSASEILKSVQGEPDNLGGCVLFNDSVLCTYLEENTTYYVATRVRSLWQYETNRENMVNSQFECCHVYISQAELTKLRDGRVPVITAADNIPEWYRSAPTETASEGEFVGLYILCLQRISVAVLMNLPAMYDERHLSKTRATISSKLSNLELKLMKAYKSLDKRAQPFNHLSYDKRSKVLRGSSVDLSSEQDMRFMTSSEIVHDSFCQRSEVSQIMMKDHTGVVLGRRIFDAELFYQSKSAPTGVATANKTGYGFKDVAHLEEQAREQLNDLNINLF